MVTGSSSKNFFAQNSSWHACFQLLNGGDAIIIISDKSIKPATKFVLLLDDVVTNGSATSIFRFAPSQSHRFVVKVHDLGFTRRSRWSVGILGQDWVCGKNGFCPC